MKPRHRRAAEEYRELIDGRYGHYLRQPSYTARTTQQLARIDPRYRYGDRDQPPPQDDEGRAESASAGEGRE